MYPIIRGKYSFSFLMKWKLLEHRQTFTMANKMALSGLGEMLYLPKLILTIDGPIVMWRGAPRSSTPLWTRGPNNAVVLQYSLKGECVAAIQEVCIKLPPSSRGAGEKQFLNTCPPSLTVPRMRPKPSRIFSRIRTGSYLQWTKVWL